MSDPHTANVIPNKVSLLLVLDSEMLGGFVFGYFWVFSEWLTQHNYHNYVCRKCSHTFSQDSRLYGTRKVDITIFPFYLSHKPVVLHLHGFATSTRLIVLYVSKMDTSCLFDTFTFICCEGKAVL